MKKLLSLLAIVSIMLVVGCEKVEKTGKYKEGTHFGTYQYESYGKKYVTTAVVYVDKTGNITSAFIDSTYFKDDVYTTKKVLGDNYGMKDTSAEQGVIEGGSEWYEQIEQIEKKVVSEQGIEWLVLDESNKTDSVSGVTITVDTYYKALDAALKNAK